MEHTFGNFFSPRCRRSINHVEKRGLFLLCRTNQPGTNDNYFISSTSLEGSQSIQNSFLPISLFAAGQCLILDCPLGGRIRRRRTAPPRKAKKAHCERVKTIISCFVRWLAFMHNWRVTAWKEWQKSLDSFGLGRSRRYWKFLPFAKNAPMSEGHQPIKGVGVMIEINFPRATRGGENQSHVIMLHGLYPN